MDLILKIALGAIVAVISLFAFFWIFVFATGGFAYLLSKIGVAEDITFKHELKLIRKAKNSFLYKLMPNKLDSFEAETIDLMKHRKLPITD